MTGEALLYGQDISWRAPGIIGLASDLPGGNVPMWVKETSEMDQG